MLVRFIVSTLLTRASGDNPLQLCPNSCDQATAWRIWLAVVDGVIDGQSLR